MSIKRRHLGWTDNGKATYVTVTGLQLTVGKPYYFSVKAENNAGLESKVTSSDGVVITSEQPVYDSDNDGMPDSWEKEYFGDLTQGPNYNYDNDGISNLNEYTYTTDPTTHTPTTPPVIVEAIHGSTSFAVRIKDDNGLDITKAAPDSVRFTITHENNNPYERDLGDIDVVRVIKLPSEDEISAHLWVVYDLSLEQYKTFEPGNQVTIRVEAKDLTGNLILLKEYAFTIEEEGSYLENKSESAGANLVKITAPGDSDLEGVSLIYDSLLDKIIPRIGPSNGVPDLDIEGVTPIGAPVNLQPHTVFNRPVEVILPCFECLADIDISDLGIYLYDGTTWRLGCSSANQNKDVQYRMLHHYRSG